MNENDVLVAEIKGLLRALENESAHVRRQLAFDNVHDVKSLSKLKLYLEAIETKMDNENENELY